MSEIEISAAKPIGIEDLKPLMEQVDWGRERSEADLTRMLDGTAVLVGAWQGDRLVGFARALTDHVLRAFIEDVIVDEKTRGQGAGTRMTQALLEQLSDVREVYLFTGAESVARHMYEKQGFERMPSIYVALRRIAAQNAPASGGANPQKG